MTAISIIDLENAKLDVDHIAAISTSLELTATDRLGHTKSTLSAAIDSIKAFSNRGAWTAVTAYAGKDLVSNAGTWYVCVVAHTSSAAFATDTASKWRVYQGITVPELAASSGASLVGYMPAGVGAVATDVQNALRSGLSVNVKSFGAVGDGVTDDTLAIQAAINSFLLLKKQIYLPSTSAFYRITQPLDLRLVGTTNSDTLCIYGDGFINSRIQLDNASATSVLKYDNGWKAFDVANCTINSGSSTVTTTGNFITAGVVAGDLIVMSGVYAAANIVTVNSATSITIDRTGSATFTGKTARIYDNRTTTLNRLSVKDLQLTHSGAYSTYVSWHLGSALDFNGVTNSNFENIRVDGFTAGLKQLGGWVNNYTNVYMADCKKGFDIEQATYRWVFDKCSTSGTGSSSSSDFGMSIIYGGGISIRDHISEVEHRWLNLSGVRGCTISGGNVENVNYDYSVSIIGIPWSIDDENTWSSGISIGGVRFYNSLGVLLGNGVKGVKIQANNFEINGPGFSPTKLAWIIPNGELNLVRNIDESENTFPIGYESESHILQSASYATLDTAQSITQNGKRYCYAAAPYYGKYWKVGDYLHKFPGNIVNGGIEGWYCTSASTGSDGSATWRASGSVSNTSNTVVN